MNNYLQALYDKIKHGDDEHQKWLKEEMEKFSNEVSSVDLGKEHALVFVINILLKDNLNNIAIPTLPMNLIIEVLEKKGFKHDEDAHDQNGWQLDFWEYFDHPTGRYCVSGSWYYGHYNIKKVNDRTTTEDN